MRYDCSELIKINAPRINSWFCDSQRARAALILDAFYCIQLGSVRDWMDSGFWMGSGWTLRAWVVLD